MDGQSVLNLKGDFNTEGTEDTEKRGRGEKNGKDYLRGEQRHTDRIGAGVVRREDKRIAGEKIIAVK
jgi:hypothetical protein